MKKTVKFLTNRRNISEKFGRGYIEQAFRRAVVHSDLLHGAENEPYMLRRDFTLVGTGRFSAEAPKVQGCSMPIRVKVEQENDLA